MLYGMTFSL